VQSIFRAKFFWFASVHLHRWKANKNDLDC
jgi:hypothetical protein